MDMIRDYAMKVHELIEVPRNELRRKVYLENRLEYSDLLEEFEKAYFEKCLKIEEMLEEAYEKIKLRENKEVS